MPFGIQHSGPNSEDLDWIAFATPEDGGQFFSDKGFVLDPWQQIDIS